MLSSEIKWIFLIAGLQNIIEKLRKNVIKRKKEKFHSATVCSAIIGDKNNNKQKSFSVKADIFYDQCISYLDKWFPFDYNF